METKHCSGMGDFLHEEFTVITCCTAAEVKEQSGHVLAVQSVH